MVITIATYAAAANGGTYIVSYGPMAIGVFAMARGLIHVMRDRKAAGSQQAAGYPGFAAAGGGQPEAYPQQPGGWPADSAGDGAPAAGHPGYGYAGPGDGAPAPGPGGPAAATPRAASFAATQAASAAAPPAPNWYPDPQDASHLRWWDGRAWTTHTQPRG